MSSNFDVILIPHSGINYGGYARSVIFSRILNVRKSKPISDILYIGALHNPTTSPQSDHSYDWVKDELHTYFPSATHYVYFPNSWQQAKKLSLQLLNTISTNDTNNHHQFLIIGTTDLTHYGRQFNFYFPQISNVKLWKYKRERPFIDSIVQINPPLMKKLYNMDHHLSCGPYSIYTILQLLKQSDQNFRGELMAYYDSSDKKYVNNLTKVDPNSFVSYVAIIFSRL